MDSRIERLHEKIEVLLEESAYQRAKLEEVHARTADIPAMVDARTSCCSGCTNLGLTQRGVPWIREVPMDHMLLARAAQQAYLAQPRLDDYAPFLITWR
jgi:hypothetical protein